MLANIVAKVMYNCNEIKGKKAFQKIFYFLTEAGVPTGLSYTLYHYGPYSAELDFQTDTLELNGIIEVNEYGMGYRITKGKKVDELLVSSSDYESIIDDVLAKLPINDPMQLELLSTTHYVAKVQRDIYDIQNEDEIIKEVIKVKKDKFSEYRIREAYQKLVDDNWI